jgi:radical SAM protein with 4Fe4S-binding SPASM domain
MRYFSSSARESFESELLPASFGKVFEPFGGVTLGAESRIDASGADLEDLAGAALAIHPESGSWAFLAQPEAAFFRNLREAPRKVSLRGPEANDFIARLYRRGLIAIDGERAVDARMFDDSPNYTEGHLVELLLTEKCNLGCGYCLAGANPAMPAMTAEIARIAVDRAFAMEEAKVVGFEFSGGEPFLKFPLMQDLVAYIRGHPRRDGRSLYLSVQSNGTLLDRERVNWIKANGVQIGISFDGQPWSQNTSRPMVNGKASFDRLVHGIDLLQEAGVPFGALVVLNSSNVGSAEDLIDFLLENDVRSLKLNPVSYLGAARDNWDRVGLTEDEIIAYFQSFLELVVSHRYPIVEANLATMLRFLVSKQRATRCMRGHCGAGDSFQAVSAAGDIYPCGRATQTPAMKLGNVLDKPCESLSEPARRHPLVSEIRSRRPSGLEGCSTCPYRQLCQAGCSMQAYERYGVVRHRTPECRFFKTMYPWLMARLSHDPVAFSVVNGLGYFGTAAELVVHDHRLH